QVDPQSVVSNRACEPSEGNILGNSSQRDTNTSATRTPANNAALKGLAIAKGGTTVVPNIFSGEFFGSFFGVKKERPVAASDGKVAGRVNKTLSTSMDHTSSSSHILLLSTIFILLNFCFISATHAQSPTHHSGGGAAEVVVDSTHLRKGIDVQEVEPLLVGQQMPDHFWERDYLVYSDGDTTRQKLDAHRKKLIVLDFWATWCAICLGRMKRTDSLFAKFPENVKLIYVNPVQTKDTYETIVNIQDKLSQMSLSG